MAKLKIELAPFFRRMLEQHNALTKIKEECLDEIYAGYGTNDVMLQLRQCVDYQLQIEDRLLILN